MRTDLDLEFVRELHPAEPAAQAAGERARAALLAEIERAAASPGVRRQAIRRSPRRRRRRLAPVGLAAALAAVAAAIVLAVSLHGGAANPPSAAAAVLQRAARAAEAAGGPRQLRPGEYWYVKSVWTLAGATFPDPSVRGGILQIPSAVSSYTRQAWIGLDRQGRVESRVIGTVMFLSPAARQEWIRAGRPRALPGYHGSLPPNAFIEPYTKLLRLPTNVDALWELLYREAGKGSAAWKRHEMFTEIGDLLREDPIPAKVRATLYRAAARIPGIQVLGLTRDGIGRPALAIALNDTLYGMRSELLFDPKTSRLLGERSVVVKPPRAYHVKPGTVHDGATYITSGIVERIGQVPAR
ncbi:MAG TPA: CU044_5270 family protein [Solirubrobacteraceae bacterium]|nr:CU044_5270 family protein [Solirubrobacteraceae bacterium]